MTTKEFEDACVAAGIEAIRYVFQKMSNADSAADFAITDHERRRFFMYSDRITSSDLPKGKPITWLELAEKKASQAISRKFTKRRRREDIPASMFDELVRKAMKPMEDIHQLLVEYRKCVAKPICRHRRDEFVVYEIYDRFDSDPMKHWKWWCETLEAAKARAAYWNAANEFAEYRQRYGVMVHHRGKGEDGKPVDEWTIEEDVFPIKSGFWW